MPIVIKEITVKTTVTKPVEGIVPNHEQLISKIKQQVMDELREEGISMSRNRPHKDR